MRTFTHFLLALLALACITLPACSPYDDGPALSLRSKGARMTFTRPLTRYVSGSIDSTTEINQVFADSILSFTGDFQFSLNQSFEYYLIDCGDGNLYGHWQTFDDYQTIKIHIPFATWSSSWEWRITRLSNKQLWLERDGGYELRFEE